METTQTNIEAWHWPTTAMSRVLQLITLVTCFWPTTALAIDKLVVHPTKHVAAVGIGDQYAGAGIGYRYRFDFGLEAGAAFGAWNEGPYGAIVVRQTPFAMLPLYVQGYFGPAIILEGQPTGGITATRIEEMYHMEVYERAPMSLGASVGLHVNRKKHHIDFNYGATFSPGAPSFVIAYGRNFGPRTLQERARHVEMNEIGGCLSPEGSTNLMCRGHRSKVTAYRICKSTHNQDEQVFACSLLQKNFRKLNIPSHALSEIRRRESILSSIRATVTTASGHQPWESQLQNLRCHELAVTNATLAEISQCDGLAGRYLEWWGKLMVDVDIIRTWTMEIETNAAMAVNSNAPYALIAQNVRSAGCRDVDASRIAFGQMTMDVLNRCRLEKQNFEAGKAHIDAKVSELNAALPTSAGHSKFRPKIEERGCTNVTTQRIGTGHIDEALVNECQTLVAEHAQWWEPLPERVTALQAQLAPSVGHTKFRATMESSGCTSLTASSIATGETDEAKIESCQKLISAHAKWFSALERKASPIVEAVASARGEYEWQQQFEDADCTQVSAQNLALGTTSQATITKCNTIKKGFTAELQRRQRAEEERRRKEAESPCGKVRICWKHKAGQTCDGCMTFRDDRAAMVCIARNGFYSLEDWALNCP